MEDDKRATVLGGLAVAFVIVALIVAVLLSGCATAPSREWLVPAGIQVGERVWTSQKLATYAEAQAFAAAWAGEMARQEQEAAKLAAEKAKVEEAAARLLAEREAEAKKPKAKVVKLPPAPPLSPKQAPFTPPRPDGR